MWTQGLTRKDFLDLVSGRTSSAATNLRESERWQVPKAGKSDVTAGWINDPVGSAWPDVLLVDSAELKEFYAWASTYLPAYRPLSAYCHVLDATAASYANRLKRDPSLEGIEGACIGLVVADAFLDSARRARRARITPTVCAGTYSFAMARALAVGLPWDDRRDPIADGWATLQRRFRRPNGGNDLRDHWRVLFEATGLCRQSQLAFTSEAANVPLGDAFHQMTHAQDIEPMTWVHLVGGRSDLVDVRQRMDGTREERVVVFEEAVRTLKDFRSNDPRARSFVCAYLGSRIAPGSFEHLGIILPYEVEFPGVTGWYAVCAGLSNPREAINFGGGLGRWLLRDLLARWSWSEPPQGDIAASELDVLLGGDKPVEFWTTYAGYVRVELAPFVYSLAKWPPAETEASSDTGARSEEAARLLEQLGDALDRAQHTYRRLTGEPHRRVDRSGRK
jgi:hypothetical protein